MQGHLAMFTWHNITDILQNTCTYIGNYNIKINKKFT